MQAPVAGMSTHASEMWGSSGPGVSGEWSKTGSDEEEDPWTHGARKTWTRHVTGRCTLSAWAWGYRPGPPVLGSAPSIN